MPINVKRGDTVHHPQHGVGRVQSVRKRSFGEAEPATYAKVYFERDELTVTMIEDEVPNVVRPVLSSKEAKDLIKKIPDIEVEPSKQWKARANSNQAAIDRGEPLGYVKVVKGLSKMEAEGTLRPRDKAHLNQSMEFLTEELSCSLGKTPRQTRKLITKAVSE